MKDLSNSDVQQVSGAGNITDLINNALDAPARQVGTSIGAFAGDFFVQELNTAKNTFNNMYNSVISYLSKHH